jgi:hypothetical protein
MSERHRPARSIVGIEKWGYPMTDDELIAAVELVEQHTPLKHLRKICLVDGTVSPWRQAFHQALVYRQAAIFRSGARPARRPPNITIEEALDTPAARNHGLSKSARRAWFVLSRGRTTERS